MENKLQVGDIIKVTFEAEVVSKNAKSHVLNLHVNGKRHDSPFTVQFFENYLKQFGFNVVIKHKNGTETTI